MIATYLRPKYLLFAIVGFMMLLVMYSNERFLINMNDPKWLHYASFKWWLLPHGVAGALALFLGPSNSLIASAIASASGTASPDASTSSAHSSPPRSAFTSSSASVLHLSSPSSVRTAHSSSSRPPWGSGWQ